MICVCVVAQNQHLFLFSFLFLTCFNRAIFWEHLLDLCGASETRQLLSKESYKHTN